MNQTEKLIMNFYRSINIDDPIQLSLKTITSMLNIGLTFWAHTSAIATKGDRCTVFINESINDQRKWQHFGHEMYHYFYDETNYSFLKESYAIYGETKADYFAYHFCVPTFMLQKLKGVDVYDVMDLFNVEFEFAMRRLEMYQNKILEGSNKNARTHF